MQIETEIFHGKCPSPCFPPAKILCDEFFFRQDSLPLILRGNNDDGPRPRLADHARPSPNTEGVILPDWSFH